MDEAEQIIAAVQERDILWNRTNRNYRNVKSRAKEWQALAEELNMPVDIVKKRWRGLRNNYARNLSKNNVSNQGTEEPVGKYSVQMDFLRDHLKPKLTNEHVIESADEGSPNLEYSPFGMFVDVERTGPTMSADSSTSLSGSIRPYNSPKQKTVVLKASIIEQMCLSTMTSSDEVILKPPIAPAIVQTHSPAPSNLEDEFFCRSLVEKLSSFPIELRNSTKLEILRFINSAQMEWLRQQ